MHFACRSFIGKHNDFNWSQYWENEPDDTLLVSQKGHLFALINFTLDNGTSSITQFGKGIISQISDFYFSQSGDINTSLQSTLNHFQNELSSQFIQSTLVLVVVHHQKISFACYNTGHVIIQRQDKISQIIFGKEYQLESSIGDLVDGDKLLLCTDDFYQNISFSKIKKTLAEKNIQSIEENFLSELYTLNNQPNLAGALIEVHFDDTETSLFLEESIPSQQVFSSDIPILEKGLSSEPSVFQKIFSKKPSYVFHHDVSPIAKRKKINLIIGILLLLCLSVSFYFGYQKNKDQKIENQYQGLKTEINNKISESVAIKNINLDSALASAKQANVLLDQIQKLNVYLPEVQALKKQIDSLLTQTGEAPTASSHDIFLDLKTVFNNGQFTKILYANNEIMLIDPIVASIDNINIQTKKNKNIYKSPTVKDISHLVENNGSLFYLSNNILYSLVGGISTSRIDFTKLDMNINDLSFWNGVLYALDSTKSKIYKFVPNGSNFDSGVNWLKEGSNLDSNTISLSINSSIWLLSNSGNIRSFTRGLDDKINFSSTNLPSSGKKIITTVDAGIIVVYDKDNLVYLYKNTGELISKYNFSDKKINDISVNEKDKSVYILCDDQIIYQIGI